MRGILMLLSPLSYLGVSREMKTRPRSHPPLRTGPVNQFAVNFNISKAYAPTGSTVEMEILEEMAHPVRDCLSFRCQCSGISEKMELFPPIAPTKLDSRARILGGARRGRRCKLYRL